VPLLQSIGSEVELFGRTATRARQSRQRDIVQINRAQSRRPGSGHVGCGLQDVELRSQSGGEIRLRNLERFIGCLDTFGRRFEHALGLFEIKKRAPDFRGNAAARSFQRRHRRVPARVGRLHSSFGGEAVENVPGPIHAHQITVIEFRTDQRVALVVNFVAGKGLDVRTQLASVDQILSIFNLDIFFARLDLGPARIRAAETLIQIGMKRGVLQLSCYFKTRLVRVGLIIESEKIAQSQIRILQLRPGAGQLRLLVG